MTKTEGLHRNMRQAALNRHDGISRMHIFCKQKPCACCQETALLLALWESASGPPAKRCAHVEQQLQLAFMGSMKAAHISIQ